MASSDRQLLKKARQGHRESMRSIYLMHKDKLFTLARALVHDQHLAEDIVHDVFVSFAHTLNSLELRGSLKSYLNVSVCNRARDIIRKRIRQTGSPAIETPNAKSVDSPETLVSDQEAVHQLRMALQKVPFEQREVLLLRTQAGLPYKEISRRQGIDPSAARARYRYGLAKLQKLLQKRDDLPSYSETKE